MTPEQFKELYNLVLLGTMFSIVALIMGFVFVYDELAAIKREIREFLQLVKEKL